MYDIVFGTSHGCRVCQDCGKISWGTNFVRSNVRVGGNHGTTCVFYTLAHHVVAKQSFFTFQNLFDTGRD